MCEGVCVCQSHSILSELAEILGSPGDDINLEPERDSAYHFSGYGHIKRRVS